MQAPHATMDLDVAEDHVPGAAPAGSTRRHSSAALTAAVAGSSSATRHTHHASKVKKFIVWYLSCLCPPAHETGEQIDGQYDRDFSAKDNNNTASTDRVASSSSSGPGKSSSAGHAKPRRNVLMRFLLAEHWTDGSLVALKTDIFAGVTLAVAQVAPSVAFALMGNGAPLVGLYSSFFLGIVCCVFGGRPGQITAIAGAVVVLYPDLVNKHGYGAVCAVSVIAGCFLLLPGIFRFARLVRLLPSSLMLGFCNGLALSMVIHQIPQFKRPDGNYVTGLQALYTAIICVITYAVMMLMPYFTTVVPSAFVAIVIGTAIEYIFQLGTVTIGDLYVLHGDFPKPMVPDVDWQNTDAITDIMVAAVLTAIVSSVESFMSGYKIQQLTETPTNFERESLALGAAHIMNGFFQGMSGCVVFGPCILNIECGAGTRRLSSFICAVLMVVIPLALYMVIGIVPMAALSAVLFGVSSKTADWRMLAMIFLQRISLQESVVAVVVTVVTVVSNLAIGAASGLAAALVFFMWNMARGRVRLTPMIYSNSSRAPTERASSITSGERAADEEGDVFGSVPISPASQCHPRSPVTRVDPQEREVSTTTTMMEGREAKQTPAVSENFFATAQAAAAASPNGSPLLTKSVHGEREEGDGDSPYGTHVLEVTTTTDAVMVPPQPPLQPQRRHSIIGGSYELTVNFLDVVRDEAFPEVKVLRIYLQGVLFFGSCMEFVDGMLKMLHEHHSEIFLKVTDFILDFQHGLMPVLDFSAAEAIQDCARILAKRGIRTHVQNMDPLSWACFDRVRRYFPDVCEDDVNNAKQHCYVRRIFKVAPHLQNGHDGEERDAELQQQPISAHRAVNGSDLDDNVFLHGARRSEWRAGAATSANALASEAAALRRASGNDDGGDDDDEHGAEDTNLHKPAVPSVSSEGPCTEERDAGSAREGPPHVKQEERRTNQGVGFVSGVASVRYTREEPTAAGETDAMEVPVQLSSTEACLPFADSVKLGFPIFRPKLGITVPVFDTIAGWVARTSEDIQSHRTPALEIGLTPADSIDRQFGDFGVLWWRRLWNRDIPAWVRRGHTAPELPAATTTRSSTEPLRRAMPAEFVQLPRFPGQGFAKRERLRREEWDDVRASTCRQLFDRDAPRQPNCVAAILLKAERDLVDGFV